MDWRTILAWKRLAFLKKWLPAIVVLVSSICFILKPSGGRHIDVSENTLIFDAGIFTNAVITFVTPTEIDHYGVEARNQKAGSVGATTHIDGIGVHQKMLILKITNPLPTTQTFPSSGTSYVYVVGEPGTTFQISSISINGTNCDLRDFANNKVKVHCEYVQFNFMRLWLSQIIFACNDFFSNVILTLMMFYSLWFSIQLGKMELILYFYSSKRLKRHIKKILKIKMSEATQLKEDALNKYLSIYDEKDSLFRFLQTAGPAAGFILTVTSLVQALHSPVTSASGIEGLMNGIHIAVISTFVGLLIRILALEAGRANYALFKRVADLTDVGLSDDAAMVPSKLNPNPVFETNPDNN